MICEHKVGYIYKTAPGEYLFSATLQQMAELY